MYFDSPIGPVVLLLRRGVKYPNLREAVTAVGGADKIAEGGDIDIVCPSAKDYTSATVACPIKTMWPLATQRSLHALADHIPANRGYDGTDARPRQPPTLHELFSFVNSRIL